MKKLLFLFTVVLLSAGACKKDPIVEKPIDTGTEEFKTHYSHSSGKYTVYKNANQVRIMVYDLSAKNGRSISQKDTFFLDESIGENDYDDLYLSIIKWRNVDSLSSPPYVITYRIPQIDVRNRLVMTFHYTINEQPVSQGMSDLYREEVKKVDSGYSFNIVTEDMFKEGKFIISTESVKCELFIHSQNIILTFE